MRSFGTVFSDKGPTRNGVPCETANETVTPKTLPINEIQEIFDMKQLKKIAAAAEAHYIPFAPHNPSGPIANAATLQLAACCPNFCILEIMYSDVAYRKCITDENLTYKDGGIQIGDQPGLGITLNEEECRKHPYVEHTLRHYTGALTDIRPPETEFYF